MTTTGRRVSRENRIGAVADYLLGAPIEVIEKRWGLTQATIYYWMRKTGHFKLRNGNTGAKNHKYLGRGKHNGLEAPTS